MSLYERIGQYIAPFYGGSEGVSRFLDKFVNQTMSIGCVGKFGHLFGSPRHYLLKGCTA